MRELGQTIVMVTHDPIAAAYADSVLFLADGRIVDRVDDADGRVRPRPHQDAGGMTMLNVTLKGLWAHKRRMVGTLLAVFLGVAFLSGTLVLGDTLRAELRRRSSPTSTPAPTR